MIIKVCGMRDKENILLVENIGIDIMGFIFYDKSPRYFNDGGNIDYLPKRCKRAGVFVNMSLPEIKLIATSMKLDYIQLHGNEDPFLCRLLKKEGFKVIKAFHIEKKEEIENIDKEYHNYCELLIFDTKCSGYGGCGTSFDWSILEHYNGPTPFLLSGGVGPDNIDKIRDIKNPYFMGVDLNSKFESAPGIKRTDLLKTYITEIQK